MTTLREAAQMALDALEAEAIPTTYWEQTIKALRAALAQPEQEPVAWMDTDGFPWTKEGVECRTTPDTYTPLYTAPPQRECAGTAHDRREWQGLTDEEIRNLWDGHVVPVFGKNGINPIVFASAIEAKLKEKNS